MRDLSIKQSDWQNTTGLTIRSIRFTVNTVSSTINNVNICQPTRTHARARRALIAEHYLEGTDPAGEQNSISKHDIFA